MPQDRFAARRDRLLRRLKTAGVDALLVTSPVNVRYLTGFTGEDSHLIVGRNLTVLVSDSRFETQISEECPTLDAHIRSTAQTLDRSGGCRSPPGQSSPRWVSRVERRLIRNGSRLPRR